jgi:hypothetical protein
MNEEVRLQCLQESADDPEPEKTEVTEEEPEQAPLSFTGELLESTDTPRGRIWEVVLIRSGWSANGVYYTPEAVRSALPLLESDSGPQGLAIARYKLTDRPEGHLPRRLRLAKVEGPAGNVVGFATNLRVAEIAEGCVELRADFWCTEPDTRQLLLAAQEARVTPPLGMSIDLDGFITEGMAEGRRGVLCTKFTKFLETTLVASPAAGGRIVRLVASTESDEEASHTMKLRKLWESRLRRLGRDAGQVATMTEKALCEAVLQEGLGDKAILSLAQEWLGAGKVEEVQQLLAKIIEELDAAPAVMMEAVATVRPDTTEQSTASAALAELQEARKIRCGFTLDRVLHGTGLPEMAQARLRKRFEGQVFEERELQEAVEDYKALLGSQQPAAGVEQATRVSVGAEAWDRYQAEMGVAFGIRPESAVLQESERDLYRQAARSQPSMRRIYELVFDDPGMLGNVGRNAIFQEATTANYVNTLANIMNRAIAQEYAETDDFWEELVEIDPNITDFKQRTDIIWGGYAGLPIIGESDSADVFSELGNPGEVQTQWSVGQRGAIFTITRKMMKNDDLNAFASIPRRIGRGARHELRQFIFNYLTGSVGGTIGADALYDGVALFHASHFNLVNSALDYDPLVGAWNRMSDQRLMGLKTALTGNVASNATSANVTSTRGLGAGHTIKVNGELITIAAVTNGTTLDITGGRGAFGTTAAAHTSGDAVYQLVDPIGLRKMHVLVPTEGAEKLFGLLKSPGKPGTPNNDGNMLAYLASEGRIKGHSIHKMYLKNRSNVWFCYADKADRPTVKVGFMDNQRLPRILVQDAPTVGFVFTRLAITFQALHEYGAAALDYVGAQAGIP